MFNNVNNMNLNEFLMMMELELRFKWILLKSTFNKINIRIRCLLSSCYHHDYHAKNMLIRNFKFYEEIKANQKLLKIYLFMNLDMNIHKEYELTRICLN